MSLRSQRRSNRPSRRSTTGGTATSSTPATEPASPPSRTAKCSLPRRRIAQLEKELEATRPANELPRGWCPKGTPSNDCAGSPGSPRPASTCGACGRPPNERPVTPDCWIRSSKSTRGADHMNRPGIAGGSDVPPENPGRFTTTTPTRTATPAEKRSAFSSETCPTRSTEPWPETPDNPSRLT